MGTVNLGQVRDKITSIERTSGTGAPGTTDTYTVKTECSPNGAGTFNVYNGANGADGDYEVISLPYMTPTISAENAAKIVANPDGVLIESRASFYYYESVSGNVYRYTNCYAIPETEAVAVRYVSIDTQNLTVVEGAISVGDYVIDVGSNTSGTLSSDDKAFVYSNTDRTIFKYGNDYLYLESYDSSDYPDKSFVFRSNPDGNGAFYELALSCPHINSATYTVSTVSLQPLRMFLINDSSGTASIELSLLVRDHPETVVIQHLGKILRYASFFGDSTYYRSIPVADGTYEQCSFNTETVGSPFEFSTRQINNITSVTYSELVAARNNGGLVKGRLYRITDYQCSVKSGMAYSAASNQFDIVVQALDVNVISEDAKAMHHSGDTYFTNNKLSAWELKYCLDNDEARFNWANSSGKGVVYFMKDEYGNEAPYDFKNVKQEVTFDGNTETVYTFCCLFASETIYIDRQLDFGAEVFTRNSGSDTSDYYAWFNSSGPGTTVYTEKTEGMNPTKIYSQSDVFLANVLCSRPSGYTDSSSIVSYTKNCIANKIREWFADNTMKFPNISLYSGEERFIQKYNEFGIGCHDIHSKGHLADSNSFGNSCASITMTSVEYNEIGNNSFSISLKNAASCKIGNGCRDIEFGSDCSSITIGDNCAYIRTGDSSETIDYVYAVTIGDYCRYLYINSSDTIATPSNRLRNVTVSNHLWGSSSANRITLTVSDRNLTYDSIFKNYESVEITVIAP